METFKSKMSIMHFQKIPPLTILLVVALAFLVGCSPSAATPTLDLSALATSQPRTVVVDTDMAADDWMAILYLLQRPDVTVGAITVTGAGEAHCAP